MTIAVDIDLHRIHAYCSDCGALCTSVPDTHVLYQHLNQHLGADLSIEAFPKIIVEVASPVSTQRTNVSGSAISFQLMKWAIFNIAVATQLHLDHENRVLVAPSNVWTKGYDVKTRQTLAKASAKNKDLRECEAMLFMYSLEPHKWIGFDQYLEKL